MYLLGGIFSIFLFVFVSLMDLETLRKEEKIKISLKSLKNYYNLLHFILITFINMYLMAVFFDNGTLYTISLLCFMCTYICSITDICCKNIFLNIVFIFAILIFFLNIYGNYIKISALGLIAGMLLYGIIYILSRYFYGAEVFGVGDIYILALIGFSTDLVTVLYIGLFTFVVAGIFYFIKFVFVRDLESFRKEEIPLVPFILVSYLALIYF